MVPAPTSSIRIPVVIGRLRIRERDCAVGVIRVEHLVRMCRVARRDPFATTGYQRDPSASRVNNLMMGLRAKRVELPTAVLLNLRAFDRNKHLVTDGGSQSLCLEDDILHVVDGQHRIEALTKLYRDDEDQWGDFTIPFVCMLGANEREEMEEFYVVNSNAKSVSTSLAFDLLKQRAESSPAVMDDLIASGKGWQPIAQTLVQELRKTPLWKDRIRFPLQAKMDTTISNSGLATSLKPLLASPFFSVLSTDNQLNIVGAYWEAIRRIVPEAFADPTEYSLQKGVGVGPLHQFLTSVLEYVRSKNWSVIDPESYTQVMEAPLLGLSGETPAGELAEGAGFWKSGAEGAAGSFSSHAGKRVLVARLRQRLPELEVT